MAGSAGRRGAIDAPLADARVVTRESRVRTHPHHAVGSFGERTHAQCLAIRCELRRQHDLRDIQVGSSQTVETARASDECVAVAQVKNGEDGVVGESAGLTGQVSDAMKYVAARIEYRDARIARADPEPAEAVARQRAHSSEFCRVTQQRRLFELSGQRVAEEDATAVTRDPQ